MLGGVGSQGSMFQANAGLKQGVKNHTGSFFHKSTQDDQRKAAANAQKLKSSPVMSTEAPQAAQHRDIHVSRSQRFSIRA